MPLAANCCEPFAILTVNIAGIATGTAVTNKISTKGSMETMVSPRSKETEIVMPTNTSTSENNIFTTLPTTSSMCRRGFAI